MENETVFFVIWYSFAIVFIILIVFSCIAMIFDGLKNKNKKRRMIKGWMKGIVNGNMKQGNQFDVDAFMREQFEQNNLRFNQQMMDQMNRFNEQVQREMEQFQGQQHDFMAQSDRFMNENMNQMMNDTMDRFVNDQMNQMMNDNMNRFVNDQMNQDSFNNSCMNDSMNNFNSFNDFNNFGPF